MTGNLLDQNLRSGYQATALSSPVLFERQVGYVYKSEASAVDNKVLPFKRRPATVSADAANFFTGFLLSIRTSAFAIFVVERQALPSLVLSKRQVDEE
jgi:hypothetical protein